MRYALPGKSPSTGLIWAMPIFMNEVIEHRETEREKAKFPPFFEGLAKNIRIFATSPSGGGFTKQTPPGSHSWPIQHLNPQPLIV